MYIPVMFASQKGEAEAQQPAPLQISRPPNLQEKALELVQNFNKKMAT